MSIKLITENPAKLIYCPHFADATLYQAVQKFSNGWPWIRDCCQWVTREEATAMQEAGELQPDLSYWRVRHFGLICTEHGATFTGTKERLLQGIQDFVEGWETAMKATNPVITAGRWHEHWVPASLEHKTQSKKLKLGKVTN